MMVQGLAALQTCSTLSVRRRRTVALTVMALAGFIVAALFMLPALVLLLLGGNEAPIVGGICLVIGLTAMAAGGWALSEVGRLRLTDGVCHNCGYDVRSSRKRCSECGDTMIAANDRDDMWRREVRCVIKVAAVASFIFAMFVLMMWGLVFLLNDSSAPGVYAWLALGIFPLVLAAVVLIAGIRGARTTVLSDGADV